jgi:hypothetical protein
MNKILPGREKEKALQVKKIVRANTQKYVITCYFLRLSNGKRVCINKSAI